MLVLRDLVLVLLIVGIGRVRGKGSGMAIPTCCDLGVGESVMCEAKRSKANKNSVPKPMPFFLAQRLRLSQSEQNIQWNQRDLSCPHAVFRSFSTNSASEFELSNEGFLTLRNDNLTVDYFSVSQYCINGVDDSQVYVKTCQALCSETEPCIRLCCPLGSIFTLMSTGGECVAGPSWRPSIHKKVSDKKSILSEQEWRNVQPRYFLRPYQSWKFRSCENNMTHLYSNDPEVDTDLIQPPGIVGNINFRLDSKGKLRVRQYRRWQQIADDKYCVAGATGLGSNVTKVTSIVFLCVEQAIHVEFHEQQQSGFYGALAIACSTFALITVVVYFLLLDKQNIHGWTTMAHSTAVFFLFIFLGLAHLTKEDDEIHGTTQCIIVAASAHYFFLATFTWLLILSVDLWLTFRTVSAPRRRGKGVGRFLIYSVFGWGLPGLVVGISWSLEAKYKDDPERGYEESEVPIPFYGVTFCFLARQALWEFLYAPLAILVFLNLIFFLWTSVTLYIFQKSTAMAVKNMNQDRQSFLLFVKLFLICGALWITEVISFTFSGGNITWYIQIADSLNILQPVAIFVIFVFKFEIVNALYEKYAFMRPIVYPARALLLYIRKERSNQSDCVPLHYKANETNVSRISTVDERNF